MPVKISFRLFPNLQVAVLKWTLDSLITLEDEEKPSNTLGGICWFSSSRAAVRQKENSQAGSQAKHPQNTPIRIRPHLLLLTIWLYDDHYPIGTVSVAPTFAIVLETA